VPPVCWFFLSPFVLWWVFSLFGCFVVVVYPLFAPAPVFFLRLAVFSWASLDRSLVACAARAVFLFLPPGFSRCGSFGELKEEVLFPAGHIRVEARDQRCLPGRAGDKLVTRFFLSPSGARRCPLLSSRIPSSERRTALEKILFFVSRRVRPIFAPDLDFLRFFFPRRRP